MRASLPSKVLTRHNLHSSGILKDLRKEIPLDKLDEFDRIVNTPVDEASIIQDFLTKLAQRNPKKGKDRIQTQPLQNVSMCQNHPEEIVRKSQYTFKKNVPSRGVVVGDTYGQHGVDSCYVTDTEAAMLPELDEKTQKKKLPPQANTARVRLSNRFSKII